MCHEFYQKHPGKVVSRFNFSRPFLRAWCNAVTPANVMSGFRRAGVHPFNPNAICCSEDSRSDPSSSHLSGETPSKSTDATNPPIGNAVTFNNSTQLTPTGSSTAADTPDQPPKAVESDVTFSVDEEELYRCRYEEGYDLPDPRYEEWRKSIASPRVFLTYFISNPLFTRGIYHSQNTSQK